MGYTNPFNRKAIGLDDAELDPLQKPQGIVPTPMPAIHPGLTADPGPTRDGVKDISTPQPVSTSSPPTGWQQPPAPQPPPERLTTSNGSKPGWSAPKGNSAFDSHGAPGSPVPGMPGFVYNSAGGIEPDGTWTMSPNQPTPPPPASGGSGAPPISSPMQATAPGSYSGPAIDQSISKRITDFIASQGLVASQSDPSSIQRIVQHLRDNGINSSYFTDQNGHTAGIQVNGVEYQLMNGSNQWVSPGLWQDSGGGSSRGGYGNISGDQYDDPATNDLLNFIRSRIPGLIDQGTNTPQSITDLIAAINGAAQRTANSPETAQLQELLKQAIGRANAPAYDDNQKSILRADALDQLQKSHDAAQLQARQDMAARNIPLNSGVALQMQQHIADQYARNKAMVERGLSIDEIGKLDANRQMALQAAGESANVATAQQSKVLELMKLATDIQSQDVNTRNAAMDRALSLFSVPVQIADQRFQDANAAANGISANPSSLLSTLATIASNNSAINSQNQMNSQSMWANIAKAIASIDWTGKK